MVPLVKHSNFFVRKAVSIASFYDDVTYPPVILSAAKNLPPCLPVGRTCVCARIPRL